MACGVGGLRFPSTLAACTPCHKPASVMGCMVHSITFACLHTLEFCQISNCQHNV